MVLGKKPLQVVTTGQSFLQPGVPEVAFTTITFEGGMLAHLEESWLAPVRERQLMVVGEKGMLVFDELAADGAPLKLIKKAIRLRGRTEVKIFEYLDGGTDPVEVATEPPLEAACRHFLECVGTKQEPLSGGENGLAVMRVLEAADRSLAAAGKRTAVRWPRGR
jgi:predicted dehydrogenase